jgi:hypothetical protein
VLSDRQGSEGAVKCSPGLCHQRLKEQEGQVHLPNAGHLVQKDQSSFKESIDLDVLGAVYDGIPTLQMLGPELQVLYQMHFSQQIPYSDCKGKVVSPFSTACMIAATFGKHAP